MMQAKADWLKMMTSHATKPTQRFAPGLPLIITVIIALAILLGLGTWQANKVASKTARIERLQAGLIAAPIPLPSHVDDPLALEYQRVTFNGVVSSEAPIRVYGTDTRGKAGYFLYLPVKTQFGPSVFVNFGWVPDHGKEKASLPSGAQAFSGIVRISAVAGSWTPPNDLTKGVWYTADIYEMAKHFGLGSKDFYPLRIFLDHRGEPSALPRGSQVRIDIPNNHFQYALTWYGLAAALLGVFIVFGLQRGRKTEKN